MTSLAIALIALAAGLGLIAGGIELLDRELDRRARRRSERQQRTERLMWQRLDWVSGTSSPREEPGEPPAQPRPALPDSRLPRTTMAPTAIRDPEPALGFLSPRRLLWRDTLAVLFVGVLAGFLYSNFAAPPGAGPAGGVLGATSAPTASAPSATPGTSLAATPRPTHGASPGTGPSPSPTPVRTARPTSTESPSP